MLRVKICGITNAHDARRAVELGADMLGFVFYDKSPRYITPNEARQIVKEIPPDIMTVGVFVNEKKERVQEILSETGIAAAQFHGDETPEDCAISKTAIKAFRIKKASDLGALKDYDVWAYLLDAHSEESFGGTGRAFDWDIAAGANKLGRIILAGGLTPDNVALAVQRVRPYAVDVSSGVEKEKGVKDHRKMELFIKRARGTD